MYIAFLFPLSAFPGPNIPPDKCKGPKFFSLFWAASPSENYCFYDVLGENGADDLFLLICECPW